MCSQFSPNLTDYSNSFHRHLLTDTGNCEFQFNGQLRGHLPFPCSFYGDQPLNMQQKVIFASSFLGISPPYRPRQLTMLPKFVALTEEGADQRRAGLRTQGKLRVPSPCGLNGSLELPHRETLLFVVNVCVGSVVGAARVIR